MATDLLMVFCMFPDAAAARRAAGALVDERVAACVNLLPGAASIYVWEGEKQESSETLALIKVTRAGYPALEARLRSLHPYEVPEIVAVEVEAALPAYAKWVAEQVGPGSGWIADP